jgi:hypothetical protein
MQLLLPIPMGHVESPKNRSRCHPTRLRRKETIPRFFYRFNLLTNGKDLNAIADQIIARLILSMGKGFPNGAAQCAG